jgi:cytochrome c-type biogenesis protein CcmF
VTIPEAGLSGIAACAGAGWLVVASVRYYLRGVDANRWPPLSVAGMTLAHLGVAAFLLGVGLSGSISSEKHLRMSPGDSHTLASYAFVFEGTEVVQGPNYLADRGRFVILDADDESASAQDRLVTVLSPEKRRYSQGGQVMTEAAIDAGLSRDLYVSLGEPLDEQGTAWAVRIYHKPFVRFIWLGALMMMAGGLLAAADRRYRKAGGVTD